MPVGCPSWHPLPATTNLARPEDRYRTQSIIHPPVTRFCAFTALCLLAHACSSADGTGDTRLMALPNKVPYAIDARISTQLSQDTQKLAAIDAVIATCRLLHARQARRPRLSSATTYGRSHRRDSWRMTGTRPARICICCIFNPHRIVAIGR
ncbi:hypothetical protein CCHR01_18268 [Colletotrichum chrysophilum]|uniref:Uncharacterized protein n=1 Tax=Colletotrichum chrysophilum TaxID=1836956 RepID=A0AAD9E8B9_9PEZI|nr:hypothetical protein CCHR01_18268 [Colletotrichum chrysophilum]